MLIAFVANGTLRTYFYNQLVYIFMLFFYGKLVDEK